MKTMRTEFVLNTIQGHGQTIQSENQVFIVMPLFINGNLENFIKKHPSLPNKVLAYLFKGIIFGISEMHDKNILHNDLKPDNILLRDDFNPVIGDMGLSEQMKKG